jgi:hypothetical protein
MAGFAGNDRTLPGILVLRYHLVLAGAEKLDPVLPGLKPLKRSDGLRRG